MTQALPNTLNDRFAYMAGWGEKIQKWREDSGLSLVKAGKRLGVSGPTVYDWETGKIQTLKSQNLMRICRVLKTTPAELLGERGTPQVSDSAAVYEVPKEPEISQDEQDLVLAYRQLPDETRIAVWDVIDGHLRREVPGYAEAAGARDIARSRSAEPQIVTKQISARTPSKRRESRSRK